jgi:hypothetical protein
LICGVVLRIAFSLLLEAVITFTKVLDREKRKRFNGDDVGGGRSRGVRLARND